MSDNLQARQSAIQIVFILAAVALVGKAAYLQLVDKTYRDLADAMAIQEYTVYPARGVLYDRDGELLIQNTPTYDLMVTHDQVEWENFDTTRFCSLLGMDKALFEKNISKDWSDPRFSKLVPFVFMSKLSPKAVARFQEVMYYEFPGFYLLPRSARAYPNENAAHVLGYIQEVDNRVIEKNPEVYEMGDYYGASGLEAFYEPELRGKKGTRYILKDNLGRDMGEYEGKENVAPESGTDIVTSIHLDLQAYGELLMENKIGSIVAIEPETGEILAMVSSPTYDPNLLTINQNRGAEYAKLLQNPNKVFLDRSVQAMYPPGSLFKPAVALIAMQEGVLQPDRTIRCGGGYFLGGQLLTGCHGHPTCTNVEMAIQHSCNAYFVQVFRDVVDSRGFYNPQEGLDAFNRYLDRMGLGRQLGIDFPNEKAGNYPTSAYYDDWFSRQQEGQQWNSVWVRSVGIGQGELLMTTMQMANMGAMIANRGYYITPHLLKSYRDNNRDIPEKYRKRHDVGIDRKHFDPVVNGMERAVMGGTARIAYLPDIAICGKTGTAENPHGEDHSIFFSFAPKEDPQIAIAVYVENAGFGGTYAAPIASLMIEKYIKGDIRPGRKYLENYILRADLISKP